MNSFRKPTRIAQSLLSRGVIAAGLLMLFQNCGGFASNLAYQANRSSILSSTNIFSAANEIIMIGDACYEVTPSGAQTEVPCPTPTPAPTATPEGDPNGSPTPTPTPTPSEPPTSIDLQTYCASGFSQYAGYNLRSVGSDLKVAILPDTAFQQFVDYVNSVNNTGGGVQPAERFQDVQPVCEYTDAQVASDLLNRKFTVRDLRLHCPNLAPGRYTLAVVPVTQTSNYQRNLLLSEHFLAQGLPINQGTAGESDLLRVMNRAVINIGTSVLGGPSVLSIEASSGEPGFIPMVLLDTYGQPGCDHSASPLIVQMKANSPLRLTSPAEGVKFDIMGLLAQPVAHVKKAISWLVRDAKSENYFITLPNEKGEVNGIEEMFGDNTSGPDGKFAKDGYEALRKWDGRLASGEFDETKRDGFINRYDAVFSRLRFWKDENFDGIAQAHELHSLDELNVEFIDLKANADFMEKDQFGNRITLKSVVQTRDGVLHVMYDLWFSLGQ